MLEGFAALEKVKALGDEALKFDRAHLGAVLLLLAALLPVFIVFELTLHAGGFFVEEIGEAPEQIVEVGLKARVLKHARNDVEDIGDGRLAQVSAGKGARVGLAGGWLVAVKLQLVEHARGRRSCGVRAQKRRCRCREESS